MSGKPSPAGSAGFRFEPSAAGRVFVSTAIEPLADHLFTTRQLQFRGDSLSADYARLAAAFGCHGDAIIRVRQVHGRTVLVVRPDEALTPLPEADAIVSIDPARVISIGIADCVPIVMADRRRRAVAVVHAGWRGTAAGVVGATLDVLESLGVPASDLIVAVGPSIGPCCYQVDPPVRERFGMLASGAWFVADGPGHWRLDLAKANYDQLVAKGVRGEDIALAGECTSHRPETWLSFRRDGADSGRMVAAIRLREPAAGEART